LAKKIWAKNLKIEVYETRNSVWCLTAKLHNFDFQKIKLELTDQGG